MGIDYRKDARLAIFTINRPEALNAINPQTLQELSGAMIDFRDDPELWVGIITGAGEKAFCSGADIKEMRSLSKEDLARSQAKPPTPMRGLELWKPLIAAINGLALGGGLELALCCDIRIASENARFGLPEVSRARIPGAGGTQRLPRIVPWSKATEMILMAKIISAQEACNIGLVNKVVPQNEVMATAKEWADTICQMGPLAVRAAKEAMIRGTELATSEGLELERSLFDYLQSTEDAAEGRAAFIEKRKPIYRGR